MNPIDGQTIVITWVALITVTPLNDSQVLVSDSLYVAK
jgi:hypothetical protein